jgi:CIC family chloride channel protein
MGSTVGQTLGLSDDRIRNLVACGAAAGIAATFNAPIAGVIFALEVILGQFGVYYFSTVVIASVVASVIGRLVFGNVPAFVIPVEYGVRSLYEYPCYAVLGILAGLAGAVFVRLLYGAEDAVDKVRKVPEWLLPCMGGALLGILALGYPALTGMTWETTPHIFNVGYHVIDAALAGKLAVGVALALMLLKMVATSLTLGSGGSGGVFAPSLFMGAMLGAAFGALASTAMPGMVAPPGAYALVGMGAFFAATAHAPMSAIIILFELTGDYRIILPLMLSVVTATLLAHRLLKRESIYTLKLSRRGVRLHHGRDEDVLARVQAAQVISKEVETVSCKATVSDVSRVFRNTRRHGLPVIDANGELCGLVTINDLDLAHESGISDEQPVTDIAIQRNDLVVAFPDENMSTVLERMGRRGFGRLPVVSRDNPNRLLGLIRRNDIIRAYNLALYERDAPHAGHVVRE